MKRFVCLSLFLVLFALAGCGQGAETQQPDTGAPEELTGLLESALAEQVPEARQVTLQDYYAAEPYYLLAFTFRDGGAATREQRQEGLCAAVQTETGWELLGLQYNGRGTDGDAGGCAYLFPLEDKEEQLYVVVRAVYNQQEVKTISLRGSDEEPIATETGKELYIVLAEETANPVCPPVDFLDGEGNVVTSYE